MKSPLQLREEITLTSMRLICLEDEIHQKMAEAIKIHEEKQKLQKLLKNAEMRE